MVGRLLSLWGPAYFQGRAARLRGSKLICTFFLIASCFQTMSISALKATRIIILLQRLFRLRKNITEKLFRKVTENPPFLHMVEEPFQWFLHTNHILCHGVSRIVEPVRKSVCKMNTQVYIQGGWHISTCLF